MAELAAFERQIDQIIDAIPQLHRDAQVALLLVGYEDVIRRSPVLTGAYRASHTLASGEGRPGTFLYESPSRPDPERGIRRDVGSVLEAPSVGDAKASVANVAPFQTLWIYNPIFYAGFLEFGTSRMAPRRIYGLAADRLDALAAGLKLELPAQIAAQMRTYRMAVYRALDGWRWRLVAPNGLIVADSGEAYTSRGNALRAAKRLSVVAGRAEVAVLATTDRSMDPPRRQMATDLATAADLLYTRLTTQLPLVEPDVRIAVRNGPPLKPLPNPRSDAWVLAHVLDGASIPLNIYPADRGFHLGRLEVQIFTPLGASDGDARSREIATEIDTIFRATDVDGVRCGIPEYIPQGAREDVGFWQDNLSVPFHYQSVRPQPAAFHRTAARSGAALSR